MKKSRFTEAQIVGILKQLDSGSTATELGRRHGLHANTIRLWRDKYGGMETSDLARLKHVETENAQMRRIIARQALELDAVKEPIEKTDGALAAERSGEGVARSR
ncbi:MAG: transposase, partial [Candidatus Eremiobacteraeota bacterium]|nr:transposase [Candidatus Eremiobacteraeota bacterium]